MAYFSMPLMMHHAAREPGLPECITGSIVDSTGLGNPTFHGSIWSWLASGWAFTGDNSGEVHEMHDVDGRRALDCLDLSVRNKIRETSGGTVCATSTIRHSSG